MVSMQSTKAPSPAAEMWGLGGAAYDDVSFGIADALAHGAQRLAPRPGDAALDVATGTGWTARNLARFGSRVTACDFSPRMIEAARALSAHCDPEIAFDVADAEELPYAGASFDRVISTFGVMFAAAPERAAAELARVTRSGGRLVLVTWVPDGSVAEFFGLLAGCDPAPSPAASPLDWGDPDRLRELLGDAFALDFERGTNHAYHEDEQAIWDWYARGFGPLQGVARVLDEAGRARLRRDVDAYHARYLTEAGRLHVTRDYLVTTGIRR